MKLLVRLMAHSADPSEAGLLSQRVLDALSAWSPRLGHAPEAYSKMPGWYEHVAAIEPATEATFDAVLALTPDGWNPVVRDGECDAVWNPVDDACFLVPEATWAHVLLIHAQPEAAPGQG